VFSTANFGHGGAIAQSDRSTETSIHRSPVPLSQL
jgi:hypothetical protein